MKRILYRWFLFATLMLLAISCSHSPSYEGNETSENIGHERYLSATRNRLDIWRGEAEEFSNPADRRGLALKISEIDDKLDEMENAPASEWLRRRIEVDRAFERLEQEFIAAE